MKIQTFKYGYGSGREVNFSVGNLSIRIARYQFAIWWKYNPIINKCW